MNKDSSAPTNGVVRPPTLPTTEVAPPADRPSRSAAEKLRILQEYETYAPGSAERGALLRREGVYTSQISKWRKQRERGALQALAPQPPGPKPLPQDPLMVELTHLRQETARLQARLAQAELIIDVQKKVAQLLGAVLPPAPPDEP